MILLLFRIFSSSWQKKVFLNIRRRRWILKKSNEYISRNWRMVAEGTRMTQRFCVFF